MSKPIFFTPDKWQYDLNKEWILFNNDYTYTNEPPEEGDSWRIRFYIQVGEYEGHLLYIGPEVHITADTDGDKPIMRTYVYPFPECYPFFDFEPLHDDELCSRLWESMDNCWQEEFVPIICAIDKYFKKHEKEVIDTIIPAVQKLFPEEYDNMIRLSEEYTNVTEEKEDR